MTVATYPNLARLPIEERERFLAAIAAKRKRERTTLPKWRETAHAGQIPPDGDWRTWYIRGGRGGGKTWTGSHVLADWALERPGTYAVVAPSYAAARDVCVEGESGLLRALGSHVKSWNRSMHDLRLTNGSTIFVDGADDGAPTIQGMNLSGLWADEVGLWRRWKPAWEEAIRYAVRMPGARIVATGTPKRGHGLVQALMDDPTVPKTVLPTLQNADNLDAGLIDDLIARYGGTALGRQELGGELLDDAEGALLRRSEIIHQANREALARIVVAVDPAVTSDAASDETGIIAAGLASATDSQGRSRAWVLADRSMRGRPNEWAAQVVKLYRELGADRVIAEANNGGEMVEHTLHTIDPMLPVKLVHASRGKMTRAEPIAALYQQGRVIHADDLPDLEDQWCNWEPTGGDRSPDRLDACVWALTELMLYDPWGAYRSEAAA